MREIYQFIRKPTLKIKRSHTWNSPKFHIIPRASSHHSIRYGQSGKLHFLRRTRGAPDSAAAELSWAFGELVGFRF